MSLGGNRADAEQPGFNNRLDGENTADGPRPEDDRGAPARSRPSRGATAGSQCPAASGRATRQETRCFIDDGGGRVLAAGQDRTLLTRAGRSDLRRLR